MPTIEETALQNKIKAQTAVDLIEQRLQALEHPVAGVLRLTMFSHVSDGIKKLKRQIAESLVLLLESNGYHVHNGLSEAVETLESAGYTVTPPSSEASPTEPLESRDCFFCAALDTPCELHKAPTKEPHE